MALAGMVSTADATGRSRRRGGIAKVLVLVVALAAVTWGARGLARTESLARAYFATQQGGATLSDVRASTPMPGLPPLWRITVSAAVTESGRSEPLYRSSLVLSVNPFDGSVTVAASS